MHTTSRAGIAARPQHHCTLHHPSDKMCVPAGLAVVKYKLGQCNEVQDLFARAYDIQSGHASEALSSY